MNSKKVGNRFKQKLSQVRFEFELRLIEKICTWLNSCINLKWPGIDSFTKGWISFLGLNKVNKRKVLKEEFCVKRWHLLLEKSGEQLRPTVKTGFSAEKSWLKGTILSGILGSCIRSDLEVSFLAYNRILGPTLWKFWKK